MGAFAYTHNEEGKMRYIKIMMGNVLIAGAYACITVPKEIVNGGVTSFSMILSKMTRIPTAWLADAFSLLLLAVCFLGLGKSISKGQFLVVWHI